MSDAQPGREAATDNDGLRMVVFIALFTFGLMVLVAGIAIVSLLRKPTVAPMATPESMRAAAMEATKAPVATPPSADGIVMAEGFVAERVVAVPKEIGSIASMCAMPDGSLILGPQKGKLARLDPSSGAITQIDLPIGDAQGLVFVDGVLYVVVNGEAGQGQGLYRVRDSNADGSFDQVELLRLIPGDTGEHGAHGIVLGPDKKLYLSIGNHAKIPEPASSLVPRTWAEDFLLPRMWDANGHAVGVLAPGGFVIRTDLDGKEWEVVSIGYRNAYDLAFSRDGELFTYDSDMEWDIGAPWYRPTTICQVTSGTDFGWRSGSACPPYWYVDVASPVLAIGPGSPTGLVFGDGTHFPGPWQNALYCLDWTYATIHAVFLTPEGSTYTGKREQFLAGKGLPLTDAVVHPSDGAMYVSTGGRGAASSIYRIRAVEPVRPAAAPSVALSAEQTLRRELEAGHRADAPDALVAKALASLDSDDRRIRNAARTVLEHQTPSRWIDVRLPAQTTRSTIERSLAITHVGVDGARDRVIADILALDWKSCDEAERRDILRTMLITLARHGKPEDPRRLLNWLELAFPSGDQLADRLLVEMLVALDSQVAVARALQVMESSDASPEAFDASLLSRNDSYGSVILKMAADSPRQQQIAMAAALREAKVGWNDGYRDRYFRWFPVAKRAAGGHSFAGFLDRIRDDALAKVPEAARERWTRIAGGGETEVADRPRADGPGRRWTTAEIERVAATVGANHDFARGERMYRAATCADCHRFAGIGQLGGPDLTGVGQRFGMRELAEAIAEPSAVISDQYRFEEFTLTDGNSRVGRVVNQSEKTVTIIESLLAQQVTSDIEIASITSRRPSPVSPMLAGLVDALSEAELRDLLAYLKSGGDPRDPMFAKQ